MIEPQTPAAASQGGATDEQFARAVGEELRHAREARGWRRAQLVAGLRDIDDHTLFAYEAGDRQLTLAHLVALCTRLEVPPPELLERAGQRACPATEPAPPAQ